MTTIHVILQAHIDPIWLWPWQAGLDSLLATLRSACDRLDAHPDIYFSHGEAWTYWQVEQVDPALFDRIRKHVTAGRWEIVGGWWIQPDCNLPSIEGFRKQIELGKEYFTEKFGQFPRVAFNVDSFGHSAALPTLMREAGQDRYVMMRPQEHEMKLPGRVFRWSREKDSLAVTAFRIANTYCTNISMKDDWVHGCLSELPAGVEHTMLFVGIGDHGGGPTEEQIAWCRASRDRFPGARLEFSTVARFFDAIEADPDKLPAVTGELQYHAVGCYSVFRHIKSAVRDAEQRLVQAEAALAIDPAPPADARVKLRDAWRDVCFHQFHDTIGGTCIPSAYPSAFAQLGRATATAEEIITHALRRKMNDLPADPLQRMVLFNPSPVEFDDYVETEPWLDWKPLTAFDQLYTPSGEFFMHQKVETEALTRGLTRLFVSLPIAAGGMQVLRVTPDADVSMGSKPPVNPLSPQLELIADASDTWSHGISAYGRTGRHAELSDAEPVDRGSLMWSWMRKGRVGDSRLQVEERLFCDHPYVEYLIRVHWCERHELLKWTLPLPSPAERRFDAIADGELERPLDGREYPFADWTRFELADGGGMCLVCTDVFALDCTPDAVRLTLLRSPYLAHHDPHPPRGSRGRVADQGEHAFRIRVCAGHASAEFLARQALNLRRPPVYADLTRGMPTWFGQR
jgi:alpha-mannosidase